MTAFSWQWRAGHTWLVMFHVKRESSGLASSVGKTVRTTVVVVSPFPPRLARETEGNGFHGSLSGSIPQGFGLGRRPGPVDAQSESAHVGPSIRSR